MKTITAIAIVILGLAYSVSSALPRAESGDPCSNKHSNFEMGECYTKEQVRVNAEVGLLANKIAAQFRDDAQDPAYKGVVAATLRRASSTITESQKSWKAYRDQHCSAVEYSYTTGSGAGTAYETCLFQLGQERLRELRSAFPGYGQ